MSSITWLALLIPKRRLRAWKVLVGLATLGLAGLGVETTLTRGPSAAGQPRDAAAPAAPGVPDPTSSAPARAPRGRIHPNRPGLTHFEVTRAARAA